MMMMGVTTIGCSLPTIPSGNLKGVIGFHVLAVTKNGNGDCGGGAFPSFLPREIEKIKDPFSRSLAKRIERIPVQIGLLDTCVMSSCVRPLKQSKTSPPVVLLHCFDSSCLEWRCSYPLLEEAGLEAWAVDILGWGFSDLEILPSCDVASKRYHLYQLWKSYIKRPMILVGPSLGGSSAIDFAVNFPEAVKKLILINPNVYAEGTGHLAKLPRMVAYAGVSFLKSLPLRLYANIIAFNGSSSTLLDWTNVGRLHCLLPWWEDATISFMFSGGYNVISDIKQVKHKTLIICGENDQIVSYKHVVRLHSELGNATIKLVPDSGHLPHVDNPNRVAKLIEDFARHRPAGDDKYSSTEEEHKTLSTKPQIAVQHRSHRGALISNYQSSLRT